MASLLDGLPGRRKLQEKWMLTSRLYVLERVLVPDGGGTDVEDFRYLGRNMKCRLQPLERRPDDGTARFTGTIIDITDLYVSYPADELLEPEDRIQINNRQYVIRNPYENVDDAMLNHAYVFEMPGRVTYPPTVYVP